MKTKKNKILVVGAHPDDEILGVGGTILRHIAKGDDVYVLIVTKPYTPYWTEEYIKKKEDAQKKVDEFLGIKKRFNLDLPTVKLNTIPMGELNQMIGDIIFFVKPSIIYTHFEGDLNLDHSFVFHACQVACRPPRRITLISFETLSETEWGTSMFSPNTWINITDFIDKKIEAMKIYDTELREFPHPRSLKGIRILAQKRGSEACLEFAEAFKVIWDVIE